MVILITGINGFVGTNLVKAFKDNHTIHGIDITPNIQEGVSQVGSWNDLNLSPVADVIIHLAGKAHDTKNTSTEQEYFDINVGLTKRIFDHFLASGAKKFIFFSTIKAVADTVAGDELTEETIPAPQTPYGKSKLEAERYILNQPIPGNKQVYILRPCMIHGPGNKGNLNLLFNMVKKGIPYPLGAYSNRRSFTSVQNLNWIVEQLMVQNIPSGIYQVADDEPLSTNQLSYMMAETLDRKEQIWNVSPKMINRLARFGDLLHLPLNSERLKKLTESYVVSNKKIKKALDIGQLPVSAEEGIRATLQAFRNSETGKI